MMQVKAWAEKITIPTYWIGKPEKNPMFLEKRVYQGSSGVVYPHAVIEIRFSTGGFINLLLSILFYQPGKAF